MRNYIELETDVLQHGEWTDNRTGTGTKSVISRELRFDLQKGFPLVTSKKMAIRAIFGEDLWFIGGSACINRLRQLSELSPTDFCIWQKNLEEYNERIGQPDNTDLGYIYGRVWRAKECFRGHVVDQIANLIKDIEAVKANPSHPAARRMIVDTWDAYAHTDETGMHCALPPCHYGFQCFVRNGRLTLKWHQRSVDTFLGLPFNIASYALIVHILAKITGLEVGELIFTGGDVHLYEDHIAQAYEQLSRPTHELPTLVMPDDITLEKLTNFEYTASDFELINYKHEAVLKGKMS